MSNSPISAAPLRGLTLAAVSLSALVGAQALAQTSTQVAPRMATVTLPADAGQTMTVPAEAAPATVPNMTRDNGAPIGANRNSKTAGDLGRYCLKTPR